MLMAKFTVFILQESVCLEFLSIFPSMVDVAGMLKRKHECSLLTSLEPGTQNVTPDSQP